MPDFSVSVSSAEKRRLEEFLEALRTPCKVNLNPASFLAGGQFEAEFRSKLLAHHCFIGSPLFQQSFDSAFVSSCISAGLDVEQAPSGQRFWDLKLQGRRVSLKSTMAKSLRAETLHISKLTEAAWIQDCRSATKRQSLTFELFDAYCNEVDAIVQLRYFKRERTYELVEVPVSLFSQVLKIEKKHFSSDGPTIKIPVGKEPPDFILKLDRSDAKITVTGINKGLCLVHATWRIQSGSST